MDDPLQLDILIRFFRSSHFGLVLIGSTIRKIYFHFYIYNTLQVFNKKKIRIKLMNKSCCSNSKIKLLPNFKIVNFLRINFYVKDNDNNKFRRTVST